MFTIYWLPFWLFVMHKTLKYLSVKIALAKKQKILNKNYSFVRHKCSISTLFIGLMGSGKTTIMTDVAITSEKVFLQIALDKMISFSLLFKDFNFRRYEVYLDQLFNAGVIYNLSTAKKYLKEIIKSKEFHNEFIKDNVSFDDGNTTVYLSDVLYEYGQLYFLYMRNGSLIYSNYGIRSGLFVYNNSHLRQYVDDFLSSSKSIYEISGFAHIFDFNNLPSNMYIIDSYQVRCDSILDIVKNVQECNKEKVV
jgi:hypothetical protein